MKWLIVSLESFQNASYDEKGERIKAQLKDLPLAVRIFIKAVGYYPFIVLDESSRIKTNTPMDEMKKSLQCQSVKLLNQFGERCILTGTLMTKSPLNVYDQFDFLYKGYIPETMWEMAEKYCIMITIRVGRGRRVMISSKDYDKIRNRLIRAYKLGGPTRLKISMDSVFKEYTINYPNMEHILAHKEYTPFINKEELIRRIAPITMFVQRSDVFDTKFDHFIEHPIVRTFEVSKKAKRIAKELIELGFSDNIVLGKAKALELQHRIQDICNGFEPVRNAETEEYSTVPFPENPKMSELTSLLDEIGEDKQVVIWSCRTNFTYAVMEKMDKLGISYVSYFGDTSKEEQKEAERKFAEREAMLFIANPASAGFGLNCLRHADYEIFTCIDGSVDRYHQATFRILRGEIFAPKFCYHLCAKGSMEERLFSTVMAGNELLSGTNDRKKFEFL